MTSSSSGDVPIYVVLVVCALVFAAIWIVIFSISAITTAMEDQQWKKRRPKV